MEDFVMLMVHHSPDEVQLQSYFSKAWLAAQPLNNYCVRL